MDREFVMLGCAEIGEGRGGEGKGGNLVLEAEDEP
jgi:hypothetical protein